VAGAPLPQQIRPVERQACWFYGVGKQSGFTEHFVSGINWRKAMAWPESPRDRPELERLHQKYKSGEELSLKESRWVEPIVLAARINVHDEVAERRVKRTRTVEQLFAELDKLPRK
jgi:hypothetical protein